MLRVKKTSRGKQRIEMKKIEKEEARYISFSKRRAGVFLKASELSTLCGAELAVLIFSPTGKIHSYGSPSVADVVDRFLAAGPACPLASPSSHEQACRRRAVQDMNRQIMELSRRIEAGKAKKAAMRARLDAAVCRQDCRWMADDFEGLGLEDLVRLKDSLNRLKALADDRSREILTGSTGPSSWHHHHETATPNCASLGPLEAYFSLNQIVAISPTRNGLMDFCLIS